MTGQDVIDFIRNNGLDKERVLNCEIKFDVRIKDKKDTYELIVVL